MRRTEHIIVFARAPRYGRVKRRLASDIGDLAAVDFYRQNLSRTIGELATGPWRLHIAVASDADVRHPAFAGMPIIVQPKGDIGVRMKTILRQFPHCRRLIIGSDIDGITRAHIRASFAALVRHDLVFGPALDGGFWMIGSGQSHQPAPSFLRRVRWSTQYALSDSLAALPSAKRVALMSTLADIDDGLSYQRFLGLHNLQSTR